MYYVYVLYSDSHGKFYVGMSQNLEKRLVAHNSGKAKFTKGLRPWRLVYSEFVGARIDARKRELFLKSGQGRDFIKKTVDIYQDT